MELADIRKQIRTLELAESFFPSAVLFALTDLGVFGLLAQGPRTLDEIHAGTGGDRESLRAVLDAAVALGILASDERGYAPADPAFVECLGLPESPAYLGEWVRWLQATADALFDLPTVVRTGAPSAALQVVSRADTADIMARGMDAYARARGLEILDRIDVGAFRSLLDLGCGPGTYGLAIAERFPDTRVTLLDLETPIAIARENARQRGLEDRVEFVVGDALTYETSRRFDAILVSNILHMLGAEISVDLLRRCRAMLEPGGAMLVQAMFLHESRTRPRWAALANLILRCTAASGRNHDVTETAEWLRAAGYEDVRHVPFSVWNVNSCMIARRPAGEAASTSG